MGPALQVVTANRLSDGNVVYLGPSLTWVECLADAEPVSGKEAGDARLAEALPFVAARVVVNPYLIEVDADRRPLRMREIIRAAGPTVRRDLGKQAAGA